MAVADGFTGQRLIVVPRPQVEDALSRPGTNHVVVTDCGFFPRAAAHEITRLTGVDEAIVIACVRGCGWVELGGRRHRITAGDAAIIPPGLPHAYGADANDPWTLWWMHVRSPGLIATLETAGLTSNDPVRRTYPPSRTAALLEEIVAVLARDLTAEAMLAAAGAAWHALTSVMTASSPRGRESAAERAAAMLRENSAHAIPVADLARHVNLSASQLAAVFRDRFGTSPNRYQAELRMAHARALLDTTSLTIATIAGNVGYADPLYFSRRFARLHGVSPSAYRAHQKG